MTNISNSNSSTSSNQIQLKLLQEQRDALAHQAELSAINYSDKLRNKVLEIRIPNYNGQIKDMPVSSFNLAIAGYAVIDKSGKQIVTNQNDAKQIEENLRSGLYTLVGLKNGNPDKTTVIDWKTNSNFNDKYDTTDDAAATAKYEYESAKLAKQDKELETKIKKLDGSFTAFKPTDIDKEITQINIRLTAIDKQKQDLAKQMEIAAKQYSDSLSNKKIEIKLVNADGVTVTQPVKTSYLHATNIAAVYKSGANAGQEVKPTTSQGSFYDNSAQINALYDAGLIKFVEYNLAADGKVYFGDEVDVKTSRLFNYAYDTTDDAAATAKYQYETAKLQAQTKTLELEQKALETNKQSLLDKNTVLNSIKDPVLKAQALDLYKQREDLAKQMEVAAKQYSDSLSNKKIEIKLVNADGVTVTQPVKTSYLHATNIAAVYKSGANAGQEVKPTTSQGSFYDNSAQINALYDAGLIKFVEYNLAADGKVYFGDEVDVKTSRLFNYAYDTTDDAAATAKYQYETAMLQAQDKQLEVQLKAIEAKSKYNVYKNNLLNSITDPKLKAQAIQLFKQKESLANQVEIEAKQYSDSLNNKKIEIKIVDANGELHPQNISTRNLHAAGYAAVYTVDGTEVRPTANESPSTDNSANIKALYDAGLIKFVECSFNDGYLVFGDKVDVKTNPAFNYVYDTTDDAAASAKYEYENTKIQANDKALEAQLKTIEFTVKYKDPNLRAQALQIFRQKESLANQVEIEAKQYSDSLSNKKLEIKLVNADGFISTQPVKTSFLHAAGYAAVYKSGANAGQEVSPTTAQGFTYDNSANIKALYDAGLIKFVEYSLNNGAPVYGKEVDAKTNPAFNYTYDTTDDAAAAAKFQFNSAKLLTQIRALETELKNIEAKAKFYDYKTNLLNSIKNPAKKAQAAQLLQQREALLNKADIAAKQYSNAMNNNTKTDDANAKTAYERTMYSIQSQDKILELRLKQLTL